MPSSKASPRKVASVRPAAVLPDFVVHCVELLASLGPVRARRMFGGHGIDLDGLMVAIVVADELYMKVDDDSRAQWQQAGSRPFTYTSRRAGAESRTAMSYWLAPEEAMEAPAPMRPWARLALDAALRARAARPAARARKKKAG